METARQVLMAIAAILTIGVTVLLAMKDPDEKKWGLYCAILAGAAWIAFIYVLLKERSLESNVDLHIAPVGEPIDVRPTNSLPDEISTRSRDMQEDSPNLSELILGRIAKQLEPRRIEAPSKEKAIKGLQGKPKGSIEIVYLQNDSEAWIFAIDFVHLFNGAGWNVLDSPKGLPLILNLGAAPFGITIQARLIDGDSENVRLYNAVVDAVAAAGFSSAGGVDSSLPPGCCRLIVGPKETGRLEIETAEQRERVAKAERALAEVQERIKTRGFTAGELGRMREGLDAIKNKVPVEIVTPEPRFSETDRAELIGQQIARVFREAGWTVSETKDKVPRHGLRLSGFGPKNPMTNPPIPILTAVQDAMYAAGISIQSYCNFDPEKYPETHLRFHIGIDAMPW